MSGSTSHRNLSAVYNVPRSKQILKQTGTGWTLSQDDEAIDRSPWRQTASDIVSNKGFKFLIVVACVLSIVTLCETALNPYAQSTVFCRFLFYLAEIRSHIEQTPWISSWSYFLPLNYSSTMLLPHISNATAKAPHSCRILSWWWVLLFL